MRRRVELAAALALGAGEPREEVLVDPAQGVLGAVGRAAERDVADQVDELTEPLLVEAGPAEVLGQHALEGGVVALDGRHRIIDDLCRWWAAGRSPSGAPSALPWGTQKMLYARYSSGSSGSAPWACWASSSACLASKASEMYLRKIRPRTTCLYSAASMLLRRASAAAQSCASKPEGRFRSSDVPSTASGRQTYELRRLLPFAAAARRATHLRPRAPINRLGASQSAQRYCLLLPCSWRLWAASTRSHDDCTRIIRRLGAKVGAQFGDGGAFVAPLVGHLADRLPRGERWIEFGRVPCEKATHDAVQVQGDRSRGCTSPRWTSGSDGIARVARLTSA